MTWSPVDIERNLSLVIQFETDLQVIYVFSGQKLNSFHFDNPF